MTDREVPYSVHAVLSCTGRLTHTFGYPFGDGMGMHEGVGSASDRRAWAVSRARVSSTQLLFLISTTVERHKVYSPDYHPCSAWGFTKAEAEGGR